jgi:hypothetical protein
MRSRRARMAAVRLRTPLKRTPPPPVKPQLWRVVLMVVMALIVHNAT